MPRFPRSYTECGDAIVPRFPQSYTGTDLGHERLVDHHFVVLLTGVGHLLLTFQLKCFVVSI